MDAPAFSQIEAKIEDRILDQLREVPLEPGRPLLVVDCDEVMVEFGAHLARFVRERGVEMRLEHYELEGSFHDLSAGRVLDFDEVIGLIHKFFDHETAHQRAVPGAPEALARLAEVAQIVVLTNVPRHARAARIANLRTLGMDYPLVENSGGKGWPLAWLVARAAARAVFVDDSPNQIESAAKKAPTVRRIQFVGADFVARVIPHAPEAEAHVVDWEDAEARIRDCLGAGAEG